MHILGMQGMMRRTYTYTEGQGFNLWNMVATIGAFTIAVSLILFMVNIALSYRKHKRNPVDPGPDPWDARSLEWMIPSPAPEHNFDELPLVEETDEFWHRKYGHDDDGRLVRIAATEDVVQKGDATDVHLPSPSYWPLVMAAGFPLVGYGLIFNYWWLVPGVLLIVLGVFGWVFEPSTDPDGGHHHDDDQPSDDRPDAAEATAGESTDADDDASSLGSDEVADAPTPEPAMASTEETTVG